MAGSRAPIDLKRELAASAGVRHEEQLTRGSRKLGLLSAGEAEVGEEPLASVL